MSRRIITNNPHGLTLFGSSVLPPGAIREKSRIRERTTYLWVKSVTVTTNGEIRDRHEFHLDRLRSAVSFPLIFGQRLRIGRVVGQ